MAAVKRNKPMEVVWRLHRGIFKASKGQLGARLLGMPTLLLRTMGRRSGERRENMLMYLDDGGTPVVFASNAGEPRDPAWWLNLKANPEAEVMRAGRVDAVTAREAEGEERERLWQAVLQVNDDYATYQERAGDRPVPVVVLEARG